MKTTISVIMDSGSARQVEAHVFGQWAAHASQDLGTYADYAITHVPTGLMCPMAELIDISKREAIAVARHLGGSVTSTAGESAIILDDAKRGTLSETSRAFADRVMAAVRAYFSTSKGGGV